MNRRSMSQTYPIQGHKALRVHDNYLAENRKLFLSFFSGTGGAALRKNFVRFYLGVNFIEQLPRNFNVVELDTCFWLKVVWFNAFLARDGGQLARFFEPRR